MNGSYRDPGNMHAGSYGGYNYNGMDLSISRSTSSSSHFGAVGESSRAFPSQAPPESRFRQASSCSLSSPDALPCSSSTSGGGGGKNNSGGGSNGESHGGKAASSSPADQAASAGAANAAAAAAAFAEIDETSASSGTEESGAQVASNVARAPTDSIAAATPAPEGQSPQIFPWMRKLHISHGTPAPLGFLCLEEDFFP